MKSSSAESEWDDHERALVDAYLDWKADQCSGCGRPLSESLRVEGRPDPQYVVGTSICVGCLELDSHRAARAKRDERAREDGRHPDLARRDTVLPLPEALDLARRQHL